MFTTSLTIFINQICFPICLQFSLVCVDGIFRSPRHSSSGSQHGRSGGLARIFRSPLHFPRIIVSRVAQAIHDPKSDRHLDVSVSGFRFPESDRTGEERKFRNVLCSLPFRFGPADTPEHHRRRNDSLSTAKVIIINLPIYDNILFKEL